MPTLLGLAATAAGPFSSFALISLISNLLMLVGSIFMLQVYDRVLPSRSLPTLMALLLLVGLLYLTYAAIEALRSRMTARFVNLFEERVSPLAFEAGVRARLGIYGPLQADPVRDLDTVRAFLGGAAPTVFFDLPWLPVYLAAIFLLHPLLGWITVAGALVITGLLALTEFVARRPSKDVAAATSQRQSQSDDTRNAVESVVGMVHAPAMRRRSSPIPRALYELTRGPPKRRRARGHFQRNRPTTWTPHQSPRQLSITKTYLGGRNRPVVPA